MLFTPNTSIYLLNVPIDATQANQISFLTASAQQGYFASKIIHSFAGCQFQRQDGIVKIDANVETLYNCNYVMYQNTNFANRWFYAFIVGLDYLSPNTTAVKIETDVYQTWLFDATLKDSFVVREHVNDDTIGANLQPEHLNLGEYIKNGGSQACGLGAMDIIIATTTDTGGTTGNGEMISGIFNGCYFYGSNSASSIKAFINNNASMRAGIVAVFMCPHMFTNQSSGVSLMISTDFSNELPITLSSVPTTINGYTPRNNKLMTFPFNFLSVHNNAGHAGVFPYEYFLGAPEFEITGAVMPNGAYKIRPTNINMGGSETEDIEQAISLSGFPVCCWTSDVYSSWIVQHSNQVAMTLALGGGSIIGGAFTGNVAAMGGGMLAVFNQLAAMEDKKAQPAQAGGNINSGSANASNNTIDFYLQPKSIRAEFANIIDDYFDMFGYAVNQVKVPNLWSRPSWNYIKTIDVNLIGDIPFDDMSRLKRIYNDGFTVWHDAANVGDYSKDNAIVGD